jgi:hypothetical protein
MDFGWNTTKQKGQGIGIPTSVCVLVSHSLPTEPLDRFWTWNQHNNTGVQNNFYSILTTGMNTKSKMVPLTSISTDILIAWIYLNSPYAFMVCHKLTFCFWLPYSSSLRMEAKSPSETSVTFYHNTASHSRRSYGRSESLVSHRETELYIQNRFITTVRDFSNSKLHPLPDTWINST